MKKIFYILTFICFLGFYNLKAQSSVATLDHNGITTVFYGLNALVDAYNASINGDAIVLSAGAFYPPSVIQKGLKIIGVGHYPDTINNTSSIIGGINLGLGANNVFIEGIKTGSLGNSDSISNLTIKRCYFYDSYNGITFSYSNSNIIIEGSFITILKCNNLDNNLIIRNNIFYLSDSYQPILSNIKNSSIIENNIFYFNYHCYAMFNSINNSMFINNIIYRKVGYYCGNITAPIIFENSFSNSIQNNYIDFSSGGGIDGNTNTLYNNYYGSISSILPNAGIGLDYSYDYHISNPTQYLGTDGTQIGIYGGTNPYKEKGVPSNPRIVSKFIAPQNDSNGNLQINIKAKAQNN